MTSILQKKYGVAVKTVSEQSLQERAYHLNKALEDALRGLLLAAQWSMSEELEREIADVREKVREIRRGVEKAEDERREHT